MISSALFTSTWLLFLSSKALSIDFRMPSSVASILRHFFSDLREVLPNLSTLPQGRKSVHPIYFIQQFNPEFLETIKHMGLHKKALPGRTLQGF